jgi:hypothetical protein
MRLCELRAAMREAGRAMDPRLLAVEQAVVALRDVTAIKNMATTLEGRLAARVAEGREWQRAGFASPEAWLAHQSGTSAAKAKEALETAQRLAGLPGVAAAAERGALSAEQVAVIADAAAANPAAEQRLLDAARVRPLGKLRDDCALVKRAADADAEATYQRLRAARGLRFSRALDGAARLFGASTADQVAPIKAAVDKQANELFDQARRQGRHEPREAYLMDALEQICRDWLNGERALPTSAPAADQAAADEAAADETDVNETDVDEPGPDAPARARRSGSPAWLGLVRVDLEALQRGAVEGEELCEIAGVGPVPVSVARRLLGEAVLKLVLTRGVDVVHVTHLGRAATIAQQLALLWTSPGCCVTACARMAGIEIDHRLDWAHTHHTVLGELQRCCDHHHDLKTHRRWATIRLPDGTIDMVPPTDPRHPDRARAGPDPPSPTESELDSLFDDDAA